MRITDEMIKAAMQTVLDSVKVPVWGCMDASDVKQIIKAALSTDAEPMGYVHEFRATLKSNWARDFSFTPISENDYIRNIKAVYAAPTAPSVAVKALEWEDRGDTIRDQYKASSVIGDYYVSREKSGLFSYRTYALSGTIIVGNAEEAKAAAQADYEARIRSALA